MSPVISRFSRVTSVTRSPLSTVALVQLGRSRVADMTYLGRLFSWFAHSSVLVAQRVANHSSLRRPSSRAAVPSASSYKTLPHSVRSSPPERRNQPPSRNPSLPSGSSTMPSTEQFVLITIFPMAVSPLTGVCWLPVGQKPRHRETGRAPSAQFASRLVSLPGGRCPSLGKA